MGNLLIHTGQADRYAADGILEETLVHEAAHTSLDAAHASALDWLAAQTDDASSSLPTLVTIRIVKILRRAFFLGLLCDIVARGLTQKLRILSSKQFQAVLHISTAYRSI